MFNKEIRIFYDLIKSCDKEQDKNLLLGNGFSCAYDEAFCYKNLIQKMNLDCETSNIEELINDLEEEAQNYYSASDFYLSLGDIVTAYQYECSADVENEVANIKLNFLETLAEVHPSRYFSNPTNIKFYTTINLFLFMFKNIFALIHNCFHNYKSTVISEDSVIKSIELSKYFIKCYKNIVKNNFNKNPVDEKIINYLITKNLTKITPTSLYKSNEKYFKSVDRVRNALERLSRRGYGRIVKAKNGSTFIFYNE